MVDQVRLQEVFEAWEAARAVGRELEPAALCGDDRSLADALCHRIAVFEVITAALGVGDSGASSGVGQEWDATPASGASIGKYRLLSQRGEGGFGVVFEAERTDGHRERVAVKLLRRGVGSSSGRARFAAEGQALALVRHPNIASVLDSGVSEDGVPYLAMDLIEGRPLTEYCSAHELSIRERLSLLLAVCDAVGHAHAKGVIHRDLKPANVIVMETEAGPVPKVIDFGIARITDPVNAVDTRMTREGEFVGTAAYMSPEQLGVHDEDADTRADIYSLGVMLYEVLAGVLPYQRTGDDRLSVHDLQNRMRQVAPRSLVSRLRPEGTGGASQRRESARRQRALRELSWIVMKCLELEPDRRYATCSDLAADLRRYLEGEPLSVGPQNAAYRARKFIRRNRTLVGAGVAVAASLLVAAGLSSLGFVRAVEAQGRAEHFAERAQAAAEAARWDQYVATLQASSAAVFTGDAVVAQRLLGRLPTEHAGWEARYLRYLADSSAATHDFGRQMYSVRFDRSAGSLYAVGREGTLARFESTETGPSHRRDLGADAYSVDLSPDGRWLAVGLADGHFEVMVADTLESRASIAQGDAPVVRVAFVDDRTVVAASRGGELSAWTVVDTTGTLELLWKREAASPVFAVTRIGETAWLGDESGSVTVVDSRTGMTIATQMLCASRIHDIELLPDGSSVAAASVEGELFLLAPEVSRRGGAFAVVQSVRMNDPIAELSAMPDGSMLLGATHSGAIACFRLPDLVPLESRYGHTGRAYSVAAHPTQRLAASASTDGTVRVWKYGEDSPRSVGGMPARLGFAGRSDLPGKQNAGRIRVAMTGRDDVYAEIRRAAGGQPLAILAQNDAALVVHADGLLIITAKHLRRPLCVPMERLPAACAISNDGTTVATIDHEGGIRFGAIDDSGWNPARLDIPPAVPGVALSITRERLMLTRPDGQATIWHAGKRRDVRFDMDAVRPRRVAMGPAGERVAVTLRPPLADSTALRLYDTRKGQLLLTLETNLTSAVDVWFTADGEQIAVIDQAGVISRYTATPGSGLAVNQVLASE